MAESSELNDPALVPASVVRDEVVSAVLEFLEASLHQILHSRSIYSSALFERRRLYSTVVQAARHPGLVKYIQGVIQSLKGALLASELDKVVIALNTDQGTLVEQFVFDMPMVLVNMSSEDVAELEPLFRSTLLKLQNCSALLEPIPAGCTFEIWAECQSGDPLPAQAWVQQQPPECEHRIIPIKSGHLTSGHLDLQVKSTSNGRLASSSIMVH
ncbi:hypothetical protein WJX74_010099 [Apatococcus lobatus]|uniref:HORMA domain-containing protein n=1 Tax=Apatococcus lobatus TaxID=904363 RepID=A0AAW1SBY5_9CHLO